MRCRFKHKIFQNEENGYTIAIFTTQDTSVPLSARDKYLASRNIIGFSAIGFGLPLTDEIELEMEGRWESGEHGTQYQVENFMEVVPRTKEGILGYLSSGAIKGIGPKMADTIFRKFGLQTLEIMENNPQELLKIRGISEKKLAAIVESYGKNQVFRELMTFLAPFKVTPKKVNMILKKFGNESVDIIRHRPYMLSAVKGFGFLTVDAIGRQCCCALNDPMRISGCIGHIMNQAMKEGHLFKQRQEVIREALEMLNRDLQVMAVSEQDVSQVLYRLVLQKSIVVEEERIYSIRQYEEETQTASMIARRLLEKPVLLSIEPELEKAQKTLGITLSETQKQAVRMVFAHPISIITGGPGTGKTTMALAFSRAMRLKETRVQFTPDVLPADLTGFSIYQKETGQFVYQPGAVMCNILLADEINRTSPKTQSALQENMEEKQVTIDGVTRRTGDPFIVIATENPVGSAGTQLLPESQLDRFMICVMMGYQSVDEESEILRRAQSGEAVENVFPILEQTELLLLQMEVREVFVHERIYRYIAELAKATRENEWTELGISTRGTVALTKMAKAAAYLQGRNYVIPADVMDVFEDVAIHRIILNMKAKVGHIRTEELIRRIVEQVRQPSLQKRR